MIIAKPRSFFSIDWIAEGAECGPVDLNYRAFTEQGEILTDSHTFDIIKLGAFSGKWEMRSGSNEIALAYKPSAFFRRMEILSSQAEYTLQARSSLSSDFTISQEGATIGIIQRQHFFSRTAVFDGSAPIPESIQLFSLWLTILMWRRSSNSNSAACNIHL